MKRAVEAPVATAVEPKKPSSDPDAAIRELITRLIDRRVATLAKLMDERVRALEEKVRDLTDKLAANPGSASDAHPPVGSKVPAASEAARTVAAEIMNGEEWKEHVDGRFRSMFKHLEGEVIPKAVLKVLLTHESKKLAKPTE